MRRLFIALAWMALCCFGRAQDTLHVSPDLQLVRLSEHAWLHISWFESEKWGRFPSNGLIAVNKGEALLFDTPMSDWLTARLADFISDSLHLRIRAHIPNHFHDDCTAGMDVLQARGIPVWAHSLTDSILRASGLPPADSTFQDSLYISLDGLHVLCRFHGAGHAPDNIVAWLPTEKVLFPGCMAKSAHSTHLGNTSDADLREWPLTIRRVMAAYPDAQVIVPGHGGAGDQAVLQRTLELLKEGEGGK